MTYGVWGAGREGKAAVEWLLAQGESDVIVADEREDATLDIADGADNHDGADTPNEADTSCKADNRVRFFCGPQSLDHLLECSTVIVSPGVPGVHPFRTTLSEYGIKTTSGTNLWMAHHETCIGVTGTKGKSTTTTLITALLNGCGVPARLAGNIGVPLLSLPDTDQATVVELSSYQCASLTRSPKIAVIVNLYQEHLTWHGTLEQYWRDKCRIFTEGADTLIADPDTLDKIHGLGIDTSGLDVYSPSPETDDLIAQSLAQIDRIPLLFSSGPGTHNLSLAILAAQAWGVTVRAKDVARVISGFTPLPHRLNLVSEAHGHQWYDDTLSTSAESVIAAAEALRTRPRILIVGGQSRGISYDILNDYLLSGQDNPIRVITIPTNGSEIVSPYEDAHPERVHHASSLPDAVRLAAALGPDDSVVILTPGAPSYDLYPNFEAKSADYCASIDDLTSSNQQQRFVSRDEFAATSTSAPFVDPDRFRTDLDTFDQAIEDPYDR